MESHSQFSATLAPVARIASGEAATFLCQNDLFQESADGRQVAVLPREDLNLLSK